MPVKTIPPVQVIYFETRTSLNGLAKFVATVARDLYAEAARQELLPCGPLQWIYTGADGKPDTEFLLEIALPVAGQLKENSSFPQKELPAFECISAIHTGAWNHLYETYDHLVDDALAKGRAMSGINREQYVFMDFVHPANNITEVQLGIQ